MAVAVEHPGAEAPAARLFTRKDYHAMADAGILTECDRVELINGRIVAMMPIGPWHSAVASRLNHALNRLYERNGIVTMGNPVGLGTQSEPQPDVTVSRWRDDFYASAHPEAQDVILLIEVADTSRLYDLGTKRDLYASQGVAEFWVVDRDLDCIHVFRHPYDGTYRDDRRYVRGEEIPLPECGGTTLAVADIGL